MEQNNKKIIIFYGIPAVVFILLIMSFSYAYYVSNIVNTSNLSYQLNTTVNNLVLDIDGNVSINESITDFDMFGQSEDVNVIDSNQNIVLTLTNEENMPIRCSYDVLFSYDEGSDSYIKSEGSTNEFTVSLEGSVGSGYIANPSRREIPSSGTNLVLTTGYISSLGSSTETHNINVNIAFKNLAEIDQSSQIDKNYAFKIRVDNVVCSNTVFGDFANKILADNGGEQAILAKGAPDFSEQAPVLTYAEGTLPSGTSTATPNEDYYFTFANSYSLDPITGKYTLKNEDEDGNKTDVTLGNNVVQYKANPNALVGMYVGDVSGTANRSLYIYSNRIYIYKIMSVDTVTGKFTYKLLLPIVSDVDNTADGVYATDDDYTAITGRKSYYFRGAIDNNWVSFAGKYWRIIRINGDGSIRIMYSGTIAPTEETKVVMTNSSTQLSGRAFNTTRDSAEYVGWKYTLGEGHGYANSSTIKGDDSSPAVGSLEEWYYSNIASSSTYLNKINPNQILCNDRTSYTSTIGTTPASGTGTAAQYFGPYIRNIARNEPSLICPLAEDKFTVDGVVTGNEALTYPVGLITADEVKMAGLIYYSYNIKNYLYNGRYYWTASPCSFNGYDAGAFNVTGNGFLGNYSVAATLGARPVVSLKSDIAVTGTGTWNDPYVVN